MKNNRTKGKQKDEKQGRKIKIMKIDKMKKEEGRRR